MVVSGLESTLSANIFSMWRRRGEGAKMRAFLAGTDVTFSCRYSAGSPQALEGLNPPGSPTHKCNTMPELPKCMSMIAGVRGRHHVSREREQLQW